MATLSPLSNGCGYCGKTENLQRCGGCKVMLYCNREHQTLHRPSHKPACSAISRKRTKYEEEEEKLRNDPGDWMTPANVFETSVGHFWGILATRDYMRARFAFADAVGKVRTQQAVQEQLNHLMDMLQLCRGDNMGVRSLIPALMLRLNQDQRCYDFVKWWTLITDKSDYDWGDTDLPYLDIRNADVFEDVKYLDRRWMDLSHLAAVTLLKIKLVLDLEALKNTRDTVGRKVPREIQNNIRPHVVTTSVIANNRELMEHDELELTINQLNNQIHILYLAVRKTNKHFWHSLVDYEKPELPGTYSHGSLEEAQLALHYSYDSWVDTPGATKFIEEIIELC
jgi:hypothetical protein